MRLGLFPGQEEYLRKAVRDAERYRTSRRRFLVVFGAGVVGAAGIGFAGGRASAGGGAEAGKEAPPGDRLDQLRQQMRRAATGPIAELQRRHAAFLATLDNHPEDELLWLGFERLAQGAILNGDRALRDRLLISARAKVVPGHMLAIVERLKNER